MKKDKSKRQSFFILLLIISFYLFWEIRSLNLPIQDSDLSSFSCIAFRLIRNFPPHGCSHYEARFLGRWIPIMATPYHGAGEAYILLPFLLLFGMNVFSIRIFSLTTGLIALLFLYHFCKKFLNEKLSRIVVFLMAIDWTFNCGIETRFRYASFIDIFLVGSFLCFYKWYNTEKRSYFYLGCFWVGLGLFIRAWFLWYIIALITIFIAFNKELNKKFPKKELLIVLVWGTLSFCMGILPIIYYVIKTDFELTRYLIENSTHISSPCNNLQYFVHFRWRIQNLKEISTIFFNQMYEKAKFGSGIYENGNVGFISNLLSKLYFYLLGICLGWHVVTNLLRMGAYHIQKKILLILFSVMFLQTPFSITHYSLNHLTPDHLLLFLPIMKILIGMFLGELMSMSRKIKVYVLLFLLMLLVAHGYGLQQYHFALKKVNGRGVESEVIYRLVNYLSSKQIKTVLSMDQKLWHFIPLLSGGEINERYFNLVDEGTIFKIGEELENKDNIYLFRSPELSNIKFFGSFLQLAQKKNKQVKEIERFYQKEGKLMFLLYRVE